MNIKIHIYQGGQVVKEMKFDDPVKACKEYLKNSKLVDQYTKLIVNNKPYYTYQAENFCKNNLTTKEIINSCNANYSIKR